MWIEITREEYSRLFMEYGGADVNGGQLGVYSSYTYHWSSPRRLMTTWGLANYEYDSEAEGAWEAGQRLKYEHELTENPDFSGKRRRIKEWERFWKWCPSEQGGEG